MSLAAHCALFIAALAGAFLLGRLAARRKPASVAASGAALVALGGAILLVRRQDLAVKLIRLGLPAGDWILLLQVWFGPPVIFTLAALHPWLSRDRDRKAIGVFIWLIAAAVAATAASLAVRPYVELETEVGREPCLQSTDYSCGAASAVNFLRLAAGIPASEDEMARECGVLPRRGVTTIGAWWGVEKKLREKGLRADLVRPAFEDLRRLPPPILLPVRYSFLLDHMVVIVGSSAEEVQVLDPLCGATRWPLLRLRERWLGEAIVVDRRR